MKPKFPHVATVVDRIPGSPKTGHLTRDRSNARDGYGDQDRSATRDRSNARDGYGDQDRSATRDRFHRKPGSAL